MTIVLLDDDESERTLFLTVLRRAAPVLHAEVFGRFETFHAYLRTEDAPPSLLLLDYALVEGTGISLMRTLRRAGVAMPERTFMFSSLCFAAEAAAAREVGISGWVTKPGSLREYLSFAQALVVGDIQRYAIAA
ncbi:MAG: hypothetical protein AAFV53_36665 [Myxococcota bacterium]